MALFEPFDSWKPSDFEAFEQPKWRSNRFNVPRGQVRDRLKSLLEQALGRSGADWSAFELWTSRPEPNFFNDHEVRDQWALLVRPEAERARIEVVQGAVTAARPQKHHAHLGVQIDASGVRGWLRVPNEAGWDQPGWRAQQALLAMLAGVAPLRLELDGSDADGDALAAAAADGAAHEVGIVWSQSVEQALAGSGGLDDLAMWLSAALPVLQAVLVAAPEAAAPPPAAEPAPVPATEAAKPAATQAEARPWQRYRPPPVERKDRPLQQGPAAAERLVPPALRAALEREVREEEARQRAAEAARQQAIEEARRREAAWRERQQYPRRPDAPPAQGPGAGQRPWSDRGAPPPAADARTPERPRDDDRARGGFRGPPQHGPAQHGPTQHWPTQGAPRDLPPRGPGPQHGNDRGPGGQAYGDQRGGFSPGGRGRPYEVRDAAPAPAVTTLGPGAKVTLTTGLFAGKSGTVSELHGDQAQVLLGLLSVRVPVTGLQLHA